MSRTVTSLPFTELEVADGNYDKTRATIDRVIIHTMVGTWQGAAARFDNPASQVSAQYGVKEDGGIIHWLEETFTAYHAGNYAMNQRSIGIEHEDMGDYNGVRPDILYITSSKLVADICKFYSIPIDRQHILKHSEVIATGCPDALDIDRIVKMALTISNPEPTATITQKELDSIILARDTNWNLYQAELGKNVTLTNQNTQLSTNLTTSQNSLTICTIDLTNTKTSLTTCTANLTTCQNTSIPPVDGQQGLLKAKLAQIYTLANKFYFFYRGTFQKIVDLSKNG
jgi:hypothetical protein